MATNIDFNNLWKQQTAQKPSVEELLGKLKKFRSENIRKLILTNILLIITCVGIGLIWYYYQPQMLTTKIGIILIILAMVIFLAVYNQLFTNFKKLNSGLTNTEYLQGLHSLKSRQKFIQTTMMNLYFIMLSTGIGLYMYEYTSRMEPIYAITAYAATFAWIGINWFYLRPRIIRKQQAKINGLIDKFEELNNQLNDK